MEFIAIDTARTQGGIVVSREEGDRIYKISKLTLTQYGRLLIDEGLPIYAEAVQAFAFGKAAYAAKFEAKGRLEAIAAIAGVEIEYIYPQTWLAFYKFKKVGNDYQWKKYLREEAKKYNPKADTETADAILIANFVKEKKRC